MLQEHAKIAANEGGVDAPFQKEQAEETAILEEMSLSASVETDDVLSTVSSVYYDAEEGSQTPYAQQQLPKKKVLLPA